MRKVKTTFEQLPGNYRLKILSVIPLYNNEKTVRAVAEKTIAQGLPLLVVNDGSTDGGPQKLTGLQLEILNISVNSGKGAAIRKAAEWAEKNGYTHIITIDADGQHLPEEIPLFIEKIKTSPDSIIVGDRDFSSLHIPLASRLGRINSNFWLRVTSGFQLPDTQSGFRAYPVKAIAQARCRTSRYDYEIEILVRSAWAGFKLEHIPISVIYNEETRKGSHFNSLKDNIRCSVIFTRLFILKISGLAR